MNVIEGILLLLLVATIVLIIGTMVANLVPAFIERDEERQADKEAPPPPIAHLPMIDSSGESAAVLAEYARHLDREGA